MQIVKGRITAEGDNGDKRTKQKSNLQKELSI